MHAPESRRASLSGYVQPDKLLPWRWAEKRLVEARNYWITTRAPGFPSSKPVWGIWDEMRFTFSTGSRIARNIAADPRVEIHLESASEVVLVEGRARSIDARAVPGWVEEYNRKYNWDLTVEWPGVFVVTPSRVLAWISDSSGIDSGAQFANSATEWRFDGM